MQSGGISALEIVSLQVCNDCRFSSGMSLKEVYHRDVTTTL